MANGDLTDADCVGLAYRDVPKETGLWVLTGKLQDVSNEDENRVIVEWDVASEIDYAWRRPTASELNKLCAGEMIR